MRVRRSPPYKEDVNSLCSAVFVEDRCPVSITEHHQPEAAKPELAFAYFQEEHQSKELFHSFLPTLQVKLLTIIRPSCRLASSRLIRRIAVLIKVLRQQNPASNHLLNEYDHQPKCLVPEVDWEGLVNPKLHTNMRSLDLEQRFVFKAL